MAMIGDGHTKYDGANDGLANNKGACEADFRGKNVPTKARITYDGASGYLNVRKTAVICVYSQGRLVSSILYLLLACAFEL